MHHHRQYRSTDEIFNELRQRSFRLTSAKKAIVRTLWHASKPLSVQEIFADVRDYAQDVTTVYRTIEQFCDVGIAERVEQTESGVRYSLAGRAHGHNIVCTSCGREESMNECFMDEAEQRIAEATGFQKIRHVVSFYGICRTCMDSV